MLVLQLSDCDRIDINCCYGAGVTMGMSTHFEGIKPPDEQWLRMKEVWDVCIKNNINLPTEVIDFFEQQDPDPLGVVLTENKLPTNCFNEYNNEYQKGYEIYLDKLPKDIKIIRFYNSW